MDFSWNEFKFKQKLLPAITQPAVKRFWKIIEKTRSSSHVKSMCENISRENNLKTAFPSRLSTFWMCFVRQNTHAPRRTLIF
jgi:hypothetical protein